MQCVCSFSWGQDSPTLPEHTAAAQAVRVPAVCRCWDWYCVSSALRLLFPCRSPVRHKDFCRSQSPFGDGQPAVVRKSPSRLSFIPQSPDSTPAARPGSPRRSGPHPSRTLRTQPHPACGGPAPARSASRCTGSSGSASPANVERAALGIAHEGEPEVLPQPGRRRQVRIRRGQVSVDLRHRLAVQQPLLLLVAIKAHH
jgi:hypothetical protein